MNSTHGRMFKWFLLMKLHLWPRPLTKVVYSNASMKYLMPSSYFICILELVLLHSICHLRAIHVHVCFYLLPTVCVILENVHRWYISSYCAKLSLDVLEGDCGEGRKKWYPKYWQEEVRFCQYFSYNLETSHYLFLLMFISSKGKENGIFGIVFKLDRNQQ